MEEIMKKNKLKYFEILSFINDLENKYPRRKYYPYPSLDKQKKNKIKNVLSSLYQKYPENWSYGSKEVQGGKIGSRK